MPSKLFQKRKAAALKRAERMVATRADRLRVLAVVEGSKTEPNYLTEYIKRANLGRVEPFIPRDHNTSPLKLLTQTRAILERDGDFDFAFILSDRDEFTDFELAKNAAAFVNTVPNIKFIYSDPCFEIWLIFHFELYDAPITRHEAVHRLRRHIPNYQKGDVGVGAKIFDRTHIAIEHSLIALARCEELGTSCPSTLVHEVISALHSVR